MYPLSYLPVSRRARVLAAAQSAIEVRLAALRMAEAYSQQCISVPDCIAAEQHVVSCRLRVRHAIQVSHPGIEVRSAGANGWALIGYDGLTYAIYE